MYGMFVKKNYFYYKYPNEELSEGSDLGPELSISGSSIITLHIWFTWNRYEINRKQTLVIKSVATPLTQF